MEKNLSSKNRKPYKAVVVLQVSIFQWFGCVSGTSEDGFSLFVCTAVFVGTGSTWRTSCIRIS